MKKLKKRHSPKRRSVYAGDLTREIARARATGRAQGPFMETCSACGQRYWPDRRDDHMQHCCPTQVHLPGAEKLRQSVKCERKSVDPAGTQIEQKTPQSQGAVKTSRVNATTSCGPGRPRRTRRTSEPPQKEVPKPTILFGRDWSYDEFKRENLSAGIEVTRSDYARCKRHSKPPKLTLGLWPYSKAHGQVINTTTHKHGIVRWSVTPPGRE